MRTRQNQKPLLLLLIAGSLMTGAAGGIIYQLRPALQEVVPTAVPRDAIGVELSPNGWIPSQQFLGFHGDRENWYPFLFDMKTGQTQRLEALHALIRTHYKDAPFWGRWRVSPNGKWLLWGFNGREGPSQYFVAALDGSEIMVWHDVPRQWTGDIVWQADSRAWILVHRNDKKSKYLDYLQIYPLQKPRTPKTVRLQGLSVQHYIVGFSPGNRLLTCDYNCTHFTTFAPEVPTPTFQNIIMPATPESEGANMLLSPDGKRLAWCFYKPLSGLRLAIQENLRGKNMEVRVMINELDGSKQKEISSFNAYATSESRERSGLYGWSADSRKLLLLYDNALHWLPAGD